MVSNRPFPLSAWHNVGKIRTIFQCDRREGACSFRQQPLTNLQKTNADTGNITNSPENVQNSNILPPEGASPFPTVRPDRLYVFNWCLCDRRLARAGRKIRGILTPACALAQNDRSIEGFHAGARWLRMTILLGLSYWLLGSPSLHFAFHRVRYGHEKIIGAFVTECVSAPDGGRSS